MPRGELGVQYKFNVQWSMLISALKVKQVNAAAFLDHKVYCSLSALFTSELNKAPSEQRYNNSNSSNNNNIHPPS